MPSSKKFSPDRIPLILPFHPSIYPLRRIILKQYKTLMTDQDANDILKLLPITSYKRERILYSHLVRASETQSLIFSDAGIFCCKRSRCNAYKFVTNCSAMLKMVLLDLSMYLNHLPVFPRTLCMALYVDNIISFT